MNIVTIKPNVNSHANSYMLEQSSHTMDQQEETLANHLAVNVKKELNSKNYSGYPELDKFHV